MSCVRTQYLSLSLSHVKFKVCCSSVEYTRTFADCTVHQSSSRALVLSPVLRNGISLTVQLNMVLIFHTVPQLLLDHRSQLGQ